MTPCVCTPSLLVSIKGGGGLPLRGPRSDPFDRTQHSAPLSLRYWYTPQSTPPLAETWELPSLSRHACTPYYRHLRCKIVQCSRTPLCWTYGPTAGTRINPCVTVLPLASTSETRNMQHRLSPDRRVRQRQPLPPFVLACTSRRLLQKVAQHGADGMEAWSGRGLKPGQSTYGGPCLATWPVFGCSPNSKRF